MINLLEHILTVLGEHLIFTAIACAELAVGAVLVHAALRQKRHSTSRKDHRSIASLRPEGDAFLRVLEGSCDEAFLLLRVRDRMPVYAAGAVDRLLETDYYELRENLQRMLNAAADGKGTKRLQEYMDWDGQDVFQRQWEKADGTGVEMRAVRSSDGEYELLTFRDITRQQEELQEYERQLKKSEEASQVKTGFLSRMSHEIRTPMNGIKGLLELTQRSLKEDAPERAYIEKAQELSAHELALINDILDMSRIEAGKVELEEKPFRISAMQDKLHNMFAETLKERGIRYEVNRKDMTIDWCIGDELRISQIVINFLSNAVKFTEKGSIIVTFRQMLLRDGVADLMIRVEDTGIGMDPAFVQRIFRPFEQESIETGHKYGGTGLGMAITDQLVHLMGGSIVVDTAPGKGSAFTVYLHLPVAGEMDAPILGQKNEQAAADEEKISRTEEERSFEGRRILLAEDNAVNAMVAEEMLGGMGAAVETVENGQLAVEAFCAHPAGYYDLILMDVQMPVMDGRAAARAIRGLARPDAAAIPIFALSADAFVEDERRSKESGMNGHISKPVDYELLRREVLKFL